MPRANVSEPAVATSTAAWQVRPSQVPGLVDEIVAPARQRPILLITPAGTRRGPRIQPAHLPSHIQAMADIRVLDSSAAVLRLSDLLPKGLRVYGGAARIYWPQLSLSHGPQQHPVILAFEDTDPAEPLREITAALDHWQPPAAYDDWGSGTLTGRGQKLRRLHREVSRARDDATRADRRAETAEQRAEAAEREGCRLRHQLERLQAEHARLTTARRPVFADPLHQLHHELHLCWLDTVPEPEREQAPLRTYTVGPDLIESLDTDLVPRARIIRVIVDVLTGAVYTHPGRATHRQRVTPAPGSSPLIRADRATAWRCAVKTNAPAAARLLWWQLSDGSIELDRVIRHE